MAKFETTGKGCRLATSIGGVLTGRGADYIIVDDPLKSDDARSPTLREAVNDWYSNTLVSRLNDKAKGAIVIVMQRLHEDDLVGHVLGQDNWHVLSFSAVAEQDEVYDVPTPYGQFVWTRREGEALNEARESLATLDAIRRVLGPYNFAGQYQQRPAPLDGGMIRAEWLKSYDHPPDQFDSIVQSWDTASVAADLNSYSVCTTWGIKGRAFYLLNVLRKRLNYPDLKRAVRAQAQEFRADIILIENKASGIQLIQELGADGLGGIVKYEPMQKDKIMRMHAQTAIIENGFVSIPREAYWREDYIHELVTFPKGRYDDQVDSTAQMLDWARNAEYHSMVAWFDYYANLVGGAAGSVPSRMIQVEPPAGVTSWYGGKGPIRTVDADGIMEVPEEFVPGLLKAGWKLI